MLSAKPKKEYFVSREQRRLQEIIDAGLREYQRNAQLYMRRTREGIDNYLITLMLSGIITQVSPESFLWTFTHGEFKFTELSDDDKRLILYFLGFDPATHHISKRQGGVDISERGMSLLESGNIYYVVRNTHSNSQQGK